MLTHSEETQGKKSQFQSVLFLGRLLFPFNRGISIYGKSLGPHTYINHETLGSRYDKFKIKEKRN